MLGVEPQKLGPKVLSLPLSQLQQVVLFDPVEPVDAGALVQLARYDDEFVLGWGLGHRRKLCAIDFLDVLKKFNLLWIFFEGLRHIFIFEARKELALEEFQHKVRNLLVVQDNLASAFFKRHIRWIVVGQVGLEIDEEQEGNVVVVQAQRVIIFLQLRI